MLPDVMFQAFQDELTKIAAANGGHLPIQPSYGQYRRAELFAEPKGGLLGGLAGTTLGGLAGAGIGAATAAPGSRLQGAKRGLGLGAGVGLLGGSTYGKQRAVDKARFDLIQRANTQGG